MILCYNGKLYIHVLSDVGKITSPRDGSRLRIQTHHVRVFREPGDTQNFTDLFIRLHINDLLFDLTACCEDYHSIWVCCTIWL